MKKLEQVKKLRIGREKLRLLTEKQLASIAAAGPWTGSRCWCN